MPQIVNCPDCSRKLRIPDAMLGKKVQCPSCCVKFKAMTVGSEPTEQLEELEEVPESGARTARRAASSDERIGTRSERPSRRYEEEEEDDRPRSRRRRDDDEDEDYPRSRRSRYEDDPQRERQSWAKVRYGIQLVAIATWVWIIGTFVGGIFMLLGMVLGYQAVTSFDMASAGSTVTSLGLAGFSLLAGVAISGLGDLIEVIVRAVGYGLCMATPNKPGTGLRPLAITAFVLVAVTIVFGLGRLALGGFSLAASGMMMPGRGASMDMGSGLISLSSWAIMIGSFAVFLFFLRSVCRHVRERRLGGQMITVLIVYVGYNLVTGLIAVILIFATVGGTIVSASSGRIDRAADTLGVMGVISILVYAALRLGNLGMHIWYISMLQKVRAVIEAHRRDLLD